MCYLHSSSSFSNLEVCSLYYTYNKFSVHLIYSRENVFSVVVSRYLSQFPATFLYYHPSSAPYCLLDTSVQNFIYSLSPILCSYFFYTFQFALTFYPRMTTSLFSKLLLVYSQSFLLFLSYSKYAFTSPMSRCLSLIFAQLKKIIYFSFRNSLRLKYLIIIYRLALQAQYTHGLFHYCFQFPSSSYFLLPIVYIPPPNVVCHLYLYLGRSRLLVPPILLSNKFLDILSSGIRIM